MKIKLEYHDDDYYKAVDAIHAQEYVSFLQDIAERLRKDWKYNDQLPEEVHQYIDDFRDWLYQYRNENCPTLEL